MRFFGLELWQQFVTTLVGVVLAIPIGLWIERLIEKRRDNNERRKLASALYAALSRNLDLATEFHDRNGGQPYYVPFASMDLAVIAATTLRRFELFAERSCFYIEEAKVEILRFDNALSLMRTAMSTTGYSPDRPFAAASAIDAMKTRMPQIQHTIEEALAALKVEEAKGIT